LYLLVRRKKFSAVLHEQNANLAPTCITEYKLGKLATKFRVCPELKMMSSIASGTKISSRWAIRVLSCNKLFWSSTAFHYRYNGGLYLASYTGNNVTNRFCDYSVTCVHGSSVIDSTDQVLEIAICDPPPNKNPYCSRSRNLQN
jgi:hypothetical protein